MVSVATSSPSVSVRRISGGDQISGGSGEFAVRITDDAHRSDPFVETLRIEYIIGWHVVFIAFDNTDDGEDCRDPEVACFQAAGHPRTHA